MVDCKSLALAEGDGVTYNLVTFLDLRNAGNIYLVLESVDEGLEVVHLAVELLSELGELLLNRLNIVFQSSDSVFQGLCAGCESEHRCNCE